MVDKESKIDVGGSVGGNIVTGNVTGNVSSVVKGNVSSAINDLPQSTDPEKPGIKEILEQLKQAIETEPSLDEKSQAKALEQVEALAKAAQNSNSTAKNTLAENAITMLKGIFSGLQASATLIVAWNQVLPALSKLFGIG